MNVNNRYDCIIVGAGPAGIFAALELSKLNKDFKILLVDKGKEISKRKCPAVEAGKCVNCDPCSIVSGWAGAGAFSDGKLSQNPLVGGRILDYMDNKRANDLLSYVDDTYLKFGANKELYGGNKEKVLEIRDEAIKYGIQLIPCEVRHLGTEKAFDVLLGIYKALLQNKNFTFLENTTADNIITKDGKVTGITIKNKKGESQEISCEYLVVAPGRAGADWLTEQAKKLDIETVNNEIDIGVRVEVPNAIIKHLTEELYEAKLVYYSDTFENRVRTFCMSPGGVVSEEHYEGKLAVVNGHSYSDESLRTNNTNFAMLVSTKFTQPFNQPIQYGRHIASLANMLTGGGIMVQRLGDLLLGRRTDASRLKKSFTIPTLTTAEPGDLSYVLPQRYLTSIIEALKALDNICPGIYGRDTLLYGVEVKFYSSKMSVDNNFESKIEGLFTIGDGAGITRGLMQASVTGVCVARTINSRRK